MPEFLNAGLIIMLCAPHDNFLDLISFYGLHVSRCPLQSHDDTCTTCISMLLSHIECLPPKVHFALDPRSAVLISSWCCHQSALENELDLHIQGTNVSWSLKLWPSNHSHVIFCHFLLHAFTSFPPHIQFSLKMNHREIQMPESKWDSSLLASPSLNLWPNLVFSNLIHFTVPPLSQIRSQSKSIKNLTPKNGLPFADNQVPFWASLISWHCRMVY